MYGHALATRREWEYAVELGKGERYLDFMKKYAENKEFLYKREFIHECEYSLARAKRLLERRLRSKSYNTL